MWKFSTRPIMKNFQFSTTLNPCKVTLVFLKGNNFLSLRKQFYFLSLIYPCSPYQISRKLESITLNYTKKWSYTQYWVNMDSMDFWYLEAKYLRELLTLISEDFFQMFPLFLDSNDCSYDIRGCNLCGMVDMDCPDRPIDSVIVDKTFLTFGGDQLDLKLSFTCWDR